MRKSGLSIVIPTYNEAETVSKLAHRIVDTMFTADIPYEIIFIDDHSTDQTRRKINSLSQAYPIRTLVKKGKKGKGYSIYEGYQAAVYDHIAMIDADLQYPPEILPELYSQAKIHGFAVANRTKYVSTLWRRLGSRANAKIFGKFLLGLDTDIQSGLKVFPSEVFEYLDPRLLSPWAIDIPLVHTAYELGLLPGHVDIEFHPREAGTSKVSFFQTAWQVGKSAIRTKLRRRRQITLKPTSTENMQGAGLLYKRSRFVTHTTLPHHQSAIVTMTPWQQWGAVGLLFLGLIGMFLNLHATIVAAVATLSTIYFIDVLFNLFVVTKSLRFPPEVSVTPETIGKLKNSALPIYSILCPLYKEAKVLPQFIEAIEKIDWPKSKLDVLLLLEEDDTHTIEVAKAMKLPHYVRIVIVPDSQPKTKPKASNYGLALAKGEYVVVYDAEDKPDPKQLKIAYLAFTTQEPNVVCLQAKLNYYNPSHNLLTKLFTAEYSLWFDVILPGLQSINTTIPLGGTSNHFRTKTLIELHGWDPFNVTEDCDLGARLFASGYKTAIIDSTTLEEANSDTKNWFRQRSRWIKGYIQTYLVHLRNPFTFAKNYGYHAFIFQLVVGGRIAFMLINPILWGVTFSYFAFYHYVGPTIESWYPAGVFYMAIISLVFGNFIYLYNYMIGCARREHWQLIKYVFFIPIYWLMISWSAVIAVYQIFFKPHYWEKTIHGLHIDAAIAKKERDLFKQSASIARAARVQRLADLVLNPQSINKGILVASSLIGNVLNFVYNAYLGRHASIEAFGVISLIGSFMYIASVPMSALSRTVTHKSAYLLGQYDRPIKEFWYFIRNKSYLYALLCAGVWLGFSPLLAYFFHTNLVPFIIFAPVWVIGTLAAVDSGFLGGNLQFKTTAIIAISEASSKLLFSILLVQLGLVNYVYAAIPLAMLVSFTIGWLTAKTKKAQPLPAEQLSHSLQFSGKFFITSILGTFSNITFLSLDLLLAKHYLSPVDAGTYSFLTLAGKMVYFLASLVTTFTVPLVSRDVGAGRRGWRTFIKIFSITLAMSFIGFMAFGAFGYITAPLLWGPKAHAIIPYLPLYALAMVGYSLSSLIISYHQIRGEYAFSVIGFLLSFIQILGMMLFHDSVGTFTYVSAGSAIFTFLGVVTMHTFYGQLVTIYDNVLDFFGLFGSMPQAKRLEQNKLRILIFNWRDLRHKWAGGAEVYIHELAKRWVAQGHEVTLFCGNDQKSGRYQTVDGVWIIRRGGFYTVYFWAWMYYMRFFRGKYDIILDSENGIPFFTPLYAREKVYLLIHHVHQEVFRKSLRPPFSWIAMLLERRLMPLVYRKTQLITVSPSSKADIVANKLTKKEPALVYNGVDLTRCIPAKKSTVPTVLYLGRLTSLKSIAVLLQAVAKLVEKIPKLKVIIAGDGPEKKKLEKLTIKLGLIKMVNFVGRVSEEDKIQLYQQAWVFVNPSLIEGWGITTIEANACGTPVVASNVAGLRDAVHNPHSGLLVPYGNVEEFASAIADLLTKSAKRKRMSQEAIVWAKKFDWDKSAQEALDIFYI
jgi:cellulose synthase/poly-beta-1,6-N-acetylglucosamine synthase-like glycosyltransferase/glycosyltransferase involved in cell wall biosynthesis/O-antigen/teichoic acid export membrane protein